MKRLQAIAARRAQLLSECAVTRADLSQARAGLNGGMAWAGLAYAAGKAGMGKPWLRMAVAGLLALVAWRRGGGASGGK
ncbi:hypothetical protein BH11PSE7_BH11PSE7_17480 [soil metagenome]